MYTTDIPRINFDVIAEHSAREYKIRMIRQEIERVGGLEKILITDCLSNKDRDGLLVMKTLNDSPVATNPNVRYKIKILKDMWGNPVSPGDKHEWKFERKIRDMFGKKYTNRQIKEFIRRGEQREIEIWHDAIVDEKGCIDVPFKDAAILLDTRGVHFGSGQPLTNMPEYRKDMTRDHYDKDYAKVIGRQHFWLYCEIPPDTYRDLPKIKKPRKRSEDKQAEIITENPSVDTFKGVNT